MYTYFLDSYQYAIERNRLRESSIGRFEGEARINDSIHRSAFQKDNAIISRSTSLDIYIEQYEVSCYCGRIT